MFTVSDPSDFHILVVDDLSDNRFLLQTVLETEGYSVDTAEDGTSALEKIQTVLPDLILMDVMMPDLNGYEVTQRIRQVLNLAEIPILIVTAYDDAGIPRGKALGVNGFIRKPIEFDQLLSQVDTLLNAESNTGNPGSEDEAEA
jgi:CheY-like chemotaxis protein